MGALDVGAVNNSNSNNDDHDHDYDDGNNNSNALNLCDAVYLLGH